MLTEQNNSGGLVRVSKTCATPSHGLARTIMKTLAIGQWNLIMLFSAGLANAQQVDETAASVPTESAAPPASPQPPSRSAAPEFEGATPAPTPSPALAVSPTDAVTKLDASPPLPAARFLVYGDVSAWTNIGATNDGSTPSGEAISGGLRVELPKYSVDMQYRRGSLTTISAAGDAATQMVSPRTAANSFTIAAQYRWPFQALWSKSDLPGVYSYANVQFGSASWAKASSPGEKLPGVVFGASIGQSFTWDTDQLVTGGNTAALSLDVGLTYRRIMGQLRSETDRATLDAVLSTKKVDYFGGELFARVRVNTVQVGGGIVLLLGDNVSGVTKGQFLPFASVTVPIELAKVKQTPNPVVPAPPGDEKALPEVHLQ